MYGCYPRPPDCPQPSSHSPPPPKCIILIAPPHFPFHPNTMCQEMQCGAWTDAVLCIGLCSALHWLMQCSAFKRASGSPLEGCAMRGQMQYDVSSPKLPRMDAVRRSQQRREPTESRLPSRSLRAWDGSRISKHRRKTVSWHSRRGTECAPGAHPPRCSHRQVHQVPHRDHRCRSPPGSSHRCPACGHRPLSPPGSI